MTELSDKEIVAACARAIGVQPHPMWNAAKWPTPDFFGTHGVFNPLTDRAQAMELLIALRIEPWWDGDDCIAEMAQGRVAVRDADPLRAICLCAARVQIEKEKNA